MSGISKLIVLAVLFGFRAILACSCASPLPGPCGSVVADPADGQMTFVGTVTSAENPGVATKPEDYATLSYYRFHVDELLSAKESLQSVELISTRGGADCSAHFKVGVQYLIHAYKTPDGHWSTSICAGNRVASEAEEFLAQVRASRRGEKVASLYGVLQRVQQPYGTVRAADYDRPLAGVSLRLTDGDRMFQTVTDPRGHYLFYDVPGGIYQISATLPAGLELAQTILTGPPPPLKLLDHACMEHAITALPVTRITGHVIDPTGKPLGYAFVTLYRAELYGQSKLPLTWQEFQDSNKGYTFDHVAPGDYLLVFNEEDVKTPDQPFLRTFYGDSHQAGQARHLTVSESDTDITADIHVKEGSPTRQIKVNVVRSDGKPADPVLLDVKATKGTPPFTWRRAPGVYTLNLFEDARYTISAQALCFAQRTRTQSDVVSVAGDDKATDEITLHILGDDCPALTPEIVRPSAK